MHVPACRCKTEEKRGPREKRTCRRTDHALRSARRSGRKKTVQAGPKTSARLESRRGLLLFWSVVFEVSGSPGRRSAVGALGNLVARTANSVSSSCARGCALPPAAAVSGALVLRVRRPYGPPKDVYDFAFVRVGLAATSFVLSQLRTLCGCHLRSRPIRICSGAAPS